MPVFVLPQRSGGICFSLAPCASRWPAAHREQQIPDCIWNDKGMALVGQGLIFGMKDREGFRWDNQLVF